MTLPQSLEQLDSMVLDAIDEVLENSQSSSKADKTAELFQCLWMDFFTDFSNFNLEWDSDKINKFLKSSFTKIWKFVENWYWWEIDDESESLTEYYPYLFKWIPSIFHLVKRLKSKNHRIIMLKIIQVICANQLKMIMTHEPQLMKFQINTIDDWIFLLNKARFGNWKSKLDLSKIQKLNNANNYLDMIFEIVQVSNELDVYFYFYANNTCPSRKKLIDPRTYIQVFTVMVYLCCVEYCNSLK